MLEHPLLLNQSQIIRSFLEKFDNLLEPPWSFPVSIFGLPTNQINVCLKKHTFELHRFEESNILKQI